MVLPHDSIASIVRGFNKFREHARLASRQREQRRQSALILQNAEELDLLLVGMKDGNLAHQNQ